VTAKPGCFAGNILADTPDPQLAIFHLSLWRSIPTN
jgi:hypothetical protein